MMNQTPVLWSSCQDSDLSEETIRQLYPTPKYRVSIHKMKPGLTMPVVMRECKCFVVTGAVKFCRAGQVLSLDAGFFCDLPAGEFELEADQLAETVYIVVWDLDRIMGKKLLK